MSRVEDSIKSEVNAKIDGVKSELNGKMDEMQADMTEIKSMMRILLKSKSE